MTIRTYEELTTLLADNTSGDITPANLRDMLDSLSIQRALLDDRVTTTQNIAVVDTYEALDVAASVGDISNSESVSFATDGVMTITAEGLYDVVYIVGVDIDALPNNSKVFIQLWASDTNNGTDWASISAEEMFERTSQETASILRLATTQTVSTVPKYFRPSIRCTSTDSFDLTVVYISADSRPVVRPNP